MGYLREREREGRGACGRVIRTENGGGMTYLRKKHDTGLQEGQEMDEERPRAATDVSLWDASDHAV